MDDIIALIATLIVGLIIVSVLPFVSIWAINILFSTSITYTFWNWLAMFILIGIFNGYENVL